MRARQILVRVAQGVDQGDREITASAVAAIYYIRVDALLAQITPTDHGIAITLPGTRYLSFNRLMFAPIASSPDLNDLTIRL